MDIGDLIFLIFIALGVLSSLFGSKKKRPPARRSPTPTPAPGAQPRVRASEGRPRPSPAARQGAVSTQMERILRELGLEPPPELPKERPRPEQWEPEESEPAPTARIPEPPPPSRPTPAVASRNASLETLEPAGGASHKLFHERYIKQLQETSVHRGASAARHLLNPKSLRHAVLLSEILGPPKALR